MCCWLPLRRPCRPLLPAPPPPPPQPPPPPPSHVPAAAVSVCLLGRWTADMRAARSGMLLRAVHASRSPVQPADALAKCAQAARAHCRSLERHTARQPTADDGRTEHKRSIVNAITDAPAPSASQQSGARDHRHLLTAASAAGDRGPSSRIVQLKRISCSTLLPHKKRAHPMPDIVASICGAQDAHRRPRQPPRDRRAASG